MSETEASSTGAPGGPDDQVGAGDPDRSRRNSMLVTAGILLSRLAGFARERAIAHFLGLSFATDAFVAAFRIPNMLQNLLGEGVLSASFIPVYSRLLDEGRDEEAAEVAGAVAGLMAVLAGGVALLAVALADPIIAVLTPGLTAREHDLAVTLMRIVTPGIALLVLSAWALGVLNSHRRFFLSYVAPVLWNIAQIAALIVAGVLLLEDLGAPSDATADTLADLAVALAIGSVAGGLLQLLVQLPGVRKLTRVRPSLRTDLPGVRRTVKALGPVVAGRGVVQLMTFVELALASFLVGSAISALSKAQMLYILPISLFGMSVAAAELPELSSADQDDRESLGRRLDAGLERIAFFVVPSVVGFVLLGDLIVGALFRTGKFDRPDVLLVWAVLAGFSVGLVASTSSRLLQSAFYGAGDTATPARIAVVRVVTAALLGGALMLQLDRFVIGPDGIAMVAGAALPAWSPLGDASAGGDAVNHLGALGLSLAAGISGWLEFGLLRRSLRSRLDRPLRAGGASLGRIVVAGLVAAAAAFGVRLPVGTLHPIVGAAVAVPVTGLVYLVMARLLGLRDAKDLVDTVRRRLGA